MGIKQLLPFVKKACRETNIVEFKGHSIAVDVSCFLHKGLFGCMDQIANGNDSKAYLYYVKKHIQSLLDMSCHVIMVFDGRPLPAKKDTNDGRRQRRAENMMAGKILLSQGKKNEAVSKFQQAVTLTEEIVQTTIDFFRTWKNVDIIVAPYESDAQLAFLTREGFADAVITEDSDLIAFGCEKIIFKWTLDNGSCVVYNKANLPQCFHGEMSINFDFTKFRRICILSGCDYLQNGLPGIGLTKAVKFFTKTTQSNLRLVLPKIPSYLQDNKLKVSQTFIEEFIRAENTFLYQVVFDPKQHCQRPLNPYPSIENKPIFTEDDDDFISSKSPESSSDSNYDYAGVVLSAIKSVRLALGNSENDTPVNDKFRLQKNIPEWSIWGQNFVSRLKQEIKKEEEARQKAKKCGVFKLDSPKKRKHSGHEDGIKLDESPKKKIDVKSPPSKKSTTPGRGRPKKIRNEPTEEESYEDILNKFKEDTVEVEMLTSIEIIKTETKEEIVVKKEEIITIPSSSLSGSSIPPSQLSQEIKENIASIQPQTPVIGKAATFPNSCSTGKKTLGAGRHSFGKSPYFMGKSPAVSNPFKKVEINVNASPSPILTSKVEEKPKSLLSSVEDEEEDNKPTPSRLVNRFAGFKAAGLRRSATK